MGKRREGGREVKEIASIKVEGAEGVKLREEGEARLVLKGEKEGEKGGEEGYFSFEGENNHLQI